MSNQSTGKQSNPEATFRLEDSCLYDLFCALSFFLEINSGGASLRERFFEKEENRFANKKGLSRVNVKQLRNQAFAAQGEWLSISTAYSKCLFGSFKDFTSANLVGIKLICINIYSILRQIPTPIFGGDASL